MPQHRRRMEQTWSRDTDSKLSVLVIFIENSCNVHVMYKIILSNKLTILDNKSFLIKGLKTY
jgi:hypothetical protein